MYKDKDPRLELLKTESELKIFNDADFAYFYKETPVIESELEKTWVTRGQNFFLIYSEMAAGAEIEHVNQIDEFGIISILDSNKFEITWDDSNTAVSGEKVVFVPQGKSKIVFLEDSQIVRLYTKWNTNFETMVNNTAAYQEAHYHIPELEAWPAPLEEKVRVYDLYVKPDGKRFGTIYRSRYFMINAIDISNGPRDVTKLSPHSHDDFQQCSLVTKGEFIHHLRWPWRENKNEWREDSHTSVGAISTTVIPPGVIHTTEAIGTEQNKLVDIFCPPRVDFSLKDGWVLNSEDYPMLGDEE